MQKAGVPKWQRYLMYKYVRALVWINWNKFRKS